MAIAYECINIFVNREVLLRNFDVLIVDRIFERSSWHDGRIARFGAMDDLQASVLCRMLEEYGLKKHRDFGGFEQIWLEQDPDDAPGCVGMRDQTNELIVHAGNFEAFLAGQVKPKRRRATVLVQHEGKTLLVRDKHAQAFSLPGGMVEHKETVIAAAAREFKEELGVPLDSLKRLPHVDYEGQSSRHLVCMATLPDSFFMSDQQFHLNRREIAEYIWWQGEDMAMFDHVAAIMERHSFMA